VFQVGDAASRASGTTVAGAVFGSKDPDPLALRGEIYNLESGTSKLPDFDKLHSVGAIYASSLNVPERDFQQGFPGVTDRFEWFALDYKGTFFAATAARYDFHLTSDDGSKLLIDGRQVIDNDGVHPQQRVDGSVDLEAGTHSMRLQYFQGPRFGIALVLEVSVGGGPLQTFDAHAASPIQAACGEGKLRLTLDASVLFKLDRDELQPAAEAVLGQIESSVIAPHPGARLVVEGHTDDTGTDEHNDDLSMRRARTVVRWLVGHGAAADRVEAKGYGKRWPKVPNTSVENRAKNRRVEMVLLDPSACRAEAASGATGASVPGATTATVTSSDPGWAACGVVGSPCPKEKEGVTCGAKAAQGATGFSNVETCTEGVWRGFEVPPPMTPRPAASPR
jgi:outer membrane protein OmpA-like peptidoglycan-associated protein